MPTILDRIVETKLEMLRATRNRLPELKAQAEALDATLRPERSLSRALRQSSERGEGGIIAEFKRKSPSLGWIRPELQPEDVVPHYAESGAAALSVLTDTPFFGGEPAFISRVRPMVDIPILRKDFIVDAQQVYEAKVIGADAILLIAACLTQAQCCALAALAQRLGLEVLLEVHTEDELAYVCDGVSVVGVNNRNLHTFETTIETSLRLAPLMPRGMVRISESGLKTAADLRCLQEAGYEGFLMGERFMKQPDPAAELANLIKALS